MRGLDSKVFHHHLRDPSFQNDTRNDTVINLLNSFSLSTFRPARCSSLPLLPKLVSSLGFGFAPLLSFPAGVQFFCFFIYHVFSFFFFSFCFCFLVFWEVEALSGANTCILSVQKPKTCLEIHWAHVGITCHQPWMFSDSGSLEHRLQNSFISWGPSLSVPKESCENSHTSTHINPSLGNYHRFPRLL